MNQIRPLRTFLLTALLSLALLGEVLGEDFLVPLDDRPANLLFVEQIARIGRPQSSLRVPPRNLLGRLYNPGESDRIIEWVESRVKPGDTLFVSADMWLYGGLVASRTARINEEQVNQRLSRLSQIGDKGVRVILLATIPRLSLRTSDEQAPFETKLSQWAAKGDLPSAKQLLEGSDVSGFPSDVPEELVREYLGVRVRNVVTIEKMIELVKSGSVEQLILGQDDSQKTGLHRFEQQSLVKAIADQGVGAKVSLISGIDELTMTMVSGEWARRAGISPKIHVVYSDPEAAEKVPPLESLPLDTMVRQHIELSGAQVASLEESDLVLMTYVPYSQPWKVPGEERRPESEAFVKKVQEEMASGRQLAVADLSLVNRMDPFLAEASLETLSLYELEGFASWNTPANTVGTVIAQAVCHQIAERSPHWKLGERLESEKTHQAFMLARFIDDYLYQTVVRDQVRDQVNNVPSQADPLLNLFGPVGLEIRLRLVEWAKETFERHYLGRRFCLQPQGVQVEFYRSKLEVVLPWPRVFEVEARLDLRVQPTGQPCPPTKVGKKP